MTSTTPMLKSRRFGQLSLPSNIHKSLTSTRFYAGGLHRPGSQKTDADFATKERFTNRGILFGGLAAAAVLSGIYVGASALHTRMQMEKARFSTLGYTDPRKIVLAIVDLSNPSTAMTQFQNLCLMLYRDRLPCDSYGVFFRHMDELMDSSAEAKDAILQVVLDTCHRVLDVALNDAEKDPMRTVMAIREVLNRGLTVLFKVSQEQFALHQIEKGRGRRDKNPSDASSYRLIS